MQQHHSEPTLTAGTIISVMSPAIQSVRSALAEATVEKRPAASHQGRLLTRM